MKTILSEQPRPSFDIWMSRIVKSIHWADDNSMSRARKIINEKNN